MNRSKLRIRRRLDEVAGWLVALGCVTVFGGGLGTGLATVSAADAAPGHHHASPARTFRHFGKWQPVSQGLADALAEGGSKGATTRDWERCAVRYGRTTVVVCPDGHVETS